MRDVFICDAVRTPIGRFGGSLAKIRTDDLGAVPLKALKERNPNVDWSDLDEVSFGCANQAGEDNRNVARMAVLLAGFPEFGSGQHREPAVRFGARCDRQRVAGNSCRRNRFRHRRRRGVR